MRIKQNGTVFINKGLWYYSVKLPGRAKRIQIPLRAPGSDHTMKADRPRSMAIQAAKRYWEENTRQARETGVVGASVEEICAAWERHVPEYYKFPDGTPTHEAMNAVIGIRQFRAMYSNACIEELQHRDMLRLRDALEHSGIARATANKYLGIVKRMLTWALDECLISATAKAELTQVRPLKPGRSAAWEPEPVCPVDDATVEATLAHMMPNTADMVRVHRLTGMRPEEICALEWSCIDTLQTPWVYRPKWHKNAWRGNPRVILIGPRAREILLRHKCKGHPFSPVKAVAELMDAKRASRVTPIYPSTPKSRAKAHVTRTPGECWNTFSYGKTIAAACKRAGIKPWGSNRLRHAFATQVRREFGIIKTGYLLGHMNGSRITDRYSREAIVDEIIRETANVIEAIG